MPGWGNPMALSTALALDLASNGYVVVAVDPELGTEDGSHLPADTANPARRLDQVAAALDYVTGPDIAAVAGRIDRKKVAVGGHSIAGAIAFQTSIADARVHAVFDLDGWLHGPALTTPVKVPALMIEASGLDPATKAVVARTTKAVTVKLAGATHLDVTDLPCLVPALGPIAPAFGPRHDQTHWHDHHRCSGRAVPQHGPQRPQAHTIRSEADSRPGRSGGRREDIMKAIVQNEYGQAQDVLRLEETATPDIGDDEVLVNVRAAGVDRGTGTS